jgi:hypothetical protein
MAKKRKRKSPDELDILISKYDDVITSVDAEAEEDESRAYGGKVRAVKGNLVEEIADNIIKAAWRSTRRREERLRIDRKKISIPVKESYLDRIANEEIKKHIEENTEDYHYELALDKHVYIDGEFVLALECKSYTENAMMKRILVDCTLLKERHPNLSFALFQLESQLGGDYSELKGVTLGSPQTHTIMSYFDVDLSIITLLEGERKVDQPIHKSKYYKPLKKKSLRKAVQVISGIMRDYL